VWADRYFRRDLFTAREVRNVLVYVLQNFKRHQVVSESFPYPDDMSSGIYFDGWLGGPPELHLGRAPPPSRLRAAVTPLLKTHWRRHGLLHLYDVPRSLFGAS
jgi:hypothetical protein